jgi:hypothetical protein
MKLDLLVQVCHSEHRPEIRLWRIPTMRGQKVAPSFLVAHFLGFKKDRCGTPMGAKIVVPCYKMLKFEVCHQHSEW